MVELSTEFQPPGRGMGSGNRAPGMEKQKVGPNRELEIKLLIGLGLKLGFILSFYSHAPCVYSPFPVLYFINIPAPCSERILCM